MSSGPAALSLTVMESSKGSVQVVLSGPWCLSREQTECFAGSRFYRFGLVVLRNIRL